MDAVGTGPFAGSLVEARLSEGYCRASRSDAPGCAVLTQGAVHLDLFRFEDTQWALHLQAADVQDEHYRNAAAAAALPNGGNESAPAAMRRVAD